MRRKAAFTFIELLISVTIFSVIAATLYGAFNTGIMVWTRGNDAINENQKWRIFFDTISLDMRNAVPYSGVESEWDAGKVSFISAVNVSRGGRMAAELGKVAYHLDSTKGTVVRSLILFKREEKGKPADENALLENAKELGFEYAYEDAGSGSGYAWKDEWGFKDKIPIGIRIKVTLKAAGEAAPKTFLKTVYIPAGILGTEE